MTSITTDTSLWLKERLADADPRIYQYVDDVLSGRRRECTKIQLAVKRFVNDLARIGAEDFRWVFDGELASKPIRFVEKWARPTGDYDAMVFMPWQCFFYANVFGWVDPETGIRKHQRNLLLVGSGNGKTPMVAGAALYHVSQEDVRDPEVDVIANSKDQADLIVGDCRTMIDASPALAKKFRPLRTKVEFYRDGYKDKGRQPVPDGKIRAVAASAGTADGMRPTLAAFDETHEMRKYDMVRQLRRSLRKARNPLEMMTSTMGYVLDGVLVSEYRIADQMLKGSGNAAVNERLFAMIFELDEKSDPADKAAWCEANPSLGVLLKMEDLELAWETAKAIPAQKADFLTKTLNIFTKVDSASFLDWDLVQRNQDVIDIEAVRGREAFGGFDISSSGDHTSVCLIVPLDDGRMLVIPHTFVPLKVAERDAERLDYYSHVMQGDITIIEGEYVRQEYLIEWFEKWSEIFDIRCIGYDPANATLLVRSLSSWRGENKPVFTCDPVRQGALTLNAPMKHVREMFIDGRIVHNRNKLFEWYLNNVKLRKDFSTRDNENWVPVKLDKYSKIDSFMAFLDAITAWMRRCPAPGAEIPEGAGIEFFDLSGSGSPETYKPEDAFWI